MSFESLENVQDMFDYFGEEKKEMPKQDLQNNLNALWLQAFISIFPQYMKLSKGNRTTFRKAVEEFHDEESNDLVKHSALVTAHDLLFNQSSSSDVEIKKYPQPLEDECEKCQAVPSYKLEIDKEGQKIESKLCEDCEKTLREYLETCE